MHLFQQNFKSRYLFIFRKYFVLMQAIRKQFKNNVFRVLFVYLSYVLYNAGIGSTRSVKQF